jgi:hypothetical protein
MFYRKHIFGLDDQQLDWSPFVNVLRNKKLKNLQVESLILIDIKQLKCYVKI